MRLTTLATGFVLLVLTTCVCCQDGPGPQIENEVEKEVEKEVDNKIDNALETVCGAFSTDDDDKTDPQPTKRGWLSKAWKAVKNAAVGYVVNKAIGAVIGKRDWKPWTNVNGAVPQWRPWWKKRPEIVKAGRELKGDGPQADLCDSETQENIKKLEQAIEVLGRVTYLVQALKQCNATGDSP